MNKNNLTKKEAIDLMGQGKKIRHRYFASDEWVTIEGNRYVFEDGMRAPAQLFWFYRQGKEWNDGYSLVED